jgi:hypothetical protein
MGLKGELNMFVIHGSVEGVTVAVAVSLPRRRRNQVSPVATFASAIRRQPWRRSGIPNLSYDQITYFKQEFRTLRVRILGGGDDFAVFRSPRSAVNRAGNQPCTLSPMEFTCRFGLR